MSARPLPKLAAPPGVSAPRNVRRISGRAHAGLVAQLETSRGEFQPARIIDFNSSGVLLQLSDEAFKVVDRGHVKTLVVRMGRVVVGEVHHPEVVRKDPVKRTLAFLTGASYRVNTDRGGLRMLVNPVVAPLGMARHPLRVKEKIHLKLLEFSPDGFRFETSLSNKFLMAGARLGGVELTFPCLGTQTCDLVVRHVRASSKVLEVGCSIGRMSPGFRETLGQFALFGSADSLTLGERYRALRQGGFDLKTLGDSVRIRPVETLEEYDQVLALRHAAYSSVGKLLPGTTSEMMADLADDHSTILVATIGGAIVGTVRVVRCQKGVDRFPFEDYIELPDSLADRRHAILEISKLAVLPELQGTDLVLRLFQAAARETIVEGGLAVCIATRKLRRHYQRLGAQVISREVAHPVVPNESLALMVFKKSSFLRGHGVTGLGWERVGKAVVEELSHFGFTEAPPKLPAKWLQARFESWLVKLVAYFRSRFKRRHDR